MSDNVEPKKGLKPPRMVEYKGQQVGLKKLAKEHGINPRTLASRVDSGIPLEQALAMPVKPLAKKEPTTALAKAAEKGVGIRTKILNRMMEVFFEDPDRFDQWIRDKKDEDYEGLIKNFVMPFLPKGENSLLDKGPEKAVINIVFDGATPPPSITVESEAK